MRALCVVVVLLVGCGCAKPKSDYAKLGEDTLAEQITAAENGDGEAALAVADHYQFGAHDYEKGDYWCRRAAKLGELRGCACIDQKVAPLPQECQ